MKLEGPYAERRRSWRWNFSPTWNVCRCTRYGWGGSRIWKPRKIAWRRRRQARNSGDRLQTRHAGKCKHSCDIGKRWRRWSVVQSSRNRGSTLKIRARTAMILPETPARTTAHSPAMLEWRADQFRSMVQRAPTPASPECRAMAVLPARLEKRMPRSVKATSEWR